MGFFDKINSLFKSKTLNVESRFELLREAVSGTMSSFHMARDRESNQVVGLKLLDPEKLELFEARFQGLKKPSEGEIAIGMKHPSIVETLEYGVTTKGLHYLVMEFLEGPGLHTAIHNQHGMLQGNQLTLIRQMAEALGHVHKAEYIHRDICPRNFICAPDFTSLKLIDFGLTLPAEREFMQPGNRTGTPTYMAPEIVRRRWTDRRVDIFSLGVTAYHLCTFELPWRPPDDPSKAAQAAMSHDTVVPRSIFELQPELNAELGNAIMKCLSAEPKDRYNSCSDFLRDTREAE